MSNALAIASVSAVLKDLLNNAAIDHQLSNVVGEVKVSALPPDRVLVEGTPETSRINLFMYQVTPNQGWRNVDLPSRDSSGERTASPPLALDLHYLVSAYGASEFHAEILLGYAAQLLHETPVLTRDAIRRTLAPASPVTSVLPPPLDTLTASELADQVEQIRVTPETMSLEEISRLWGAIQSHYRPTAAYQASVVLIESRRSVRSALPVADDMRRIYVIPFRQPVIEGVVNADGRPGPDRRRRHPRDPRSRAGRRGYPRQPRRDRGDPGGSRPDARADRAAVDLAPPGGLAGRRQGRPGDPQDQDGRSGDRPPRHRVERCRLRPPSDDHQRPGHRSG